MHIAPVENKLSNFLWTVVNERWSPTIDLDEQDWKGREFRIGNGKLYCCCIRKDADSDGGGHGIASCLSSTVLAVKF